MKANLKAALLANAQEPIFFDRILYCDRDLLPLEHTPGVAHRLEARILHKQRLIRRFLLAGIVGD